MRCSYTCGVFLGGAVSSIEVGRSNPLSQSTIIGLFSMVGNQVSTILRKVKVDGAIPKIKFGTHDTPSVLMRVPPLSNASINGLSTKTTLSRPIVLLGE